MTESATTYTVTGMTCQHCVNAITAEVTAVDGVTTVEVDLATGTVTVRGTKVVDTAIRAAIDEAGYEVAG
jgi:copper ion binding protein